MTPSLVHKLAWITVILSWSIAFYLTAYWFLYPKAEPYYKQNVAPWLHPKAKIAWQVFKDIFVRVVKFLWQKTKDFVKSVMGW